MPSTAGSTTGLTLVSEDALLARRRVPADVEASLMDANQWAELPPVANHEEHRILADLELRHARNLRGGTTDCAANKFQGLLGLGFSLVRLSDLESDLRGDVAWITRTNPERILRGHLAAKNGVCAGDESVEVAGNDGEGLWAWSAARKTA